MTMLQGLGSLLPVFEGKPSALTSELLDFVAAQDRVTLVRMMVVASDAAQFQLAGHVDVTRCGHPCRMGFDGRRRL